MYDWIEAPQSEREIDRIDVVQEMAAEDEARQRSRDDQDRRISRLA
jgi:hypothetical protein